MSDFIIFEDADENWKNSEVLRFFVNNYVKAKFEQDDGPPQVKTSAGLEEENKFSDNKKEIQLESTSLDLKAAMKVEVDGIIEKLGELSKESYDMGNEKGTMMIEIAALKIKDLLNGENE